MPRQPLDPNFEYPLAYRLAQFLLDSSGQVNQYDQGLRQQSAGAADILESQGRQDIAKDELARRKRADADAAGEAALKANRRTASSNLIKALGKGASPEEALAGIEPGDLDPESYKFALAHLTKRPEAAPPTIAPGHGVRNKEGGYDVPIPLAEKPERPPATVAPGHGVRNPSGGYDVPVPLADKPEKPESPSAERDYHAMALDQLGPNATQAQLSKRVRELSLKDQKEIAGTRGDITLQNQIDILKQRDLVERGQKMDEAESELRQVGTILGRIEAVVPKVNTPGLLGRAAGLTTRKVQEFAQTNPDVNELAALGEGYVSVIAKIVQRQSGILSNQDLERATKSVPNTSDNLEVANRKVQILKDILGTARQNITAMRGGKLAPVEAPASAPTATPGAPPGFTPR
jgi:hypothetical protein